MVISNYAFETPREFIRREAQTPWGTTFTLSTDFFFWRLFRIIEAITVWTIFVTEKNWPQGSLPVKCPESSYANTALMTHVSLEFSYDIFDVVVPNRF